MAILPMKGEPNVSPAARALANANSVNLKDVTGSGPFGRIVKEDVEAVIKAAKQPKPKSE